MTKKINVKNLGEIQETLLITLLGRAQVSKRNSGFFYDKKALEIVENLDYDFSKFNAAFPTLEGAVIRTRVLDKWLSMLLKRNPEACVIEIGCGLNTRCDRLDNGRATWFDLDMPDVYNIWKHFFKEHARRIFLAYSAFDSSWVEIVKEKSSGPYIFIMEGSIVYFEEKLVKGLWKMIADNFGDSHMLFDSINHSWANQQNNNHAMKTVDARLKWAINDIYSIENWDKRYRVLKHEQLINPSIEIRKIYPWWILASTPFAKLFFGDALSGYYLNMAAIRGGNLSS